ncbi:MAG: hypothetical protein GY928_06915 [Colwellia sp.]|nr:hypothetical protein [Colwellia sp.]
MLSLIPINNIDYYKNLDKYDCYKSPEYIGHWQGKLKDKFDLGDQVFLDGFDNIMSSKHLNTAKDSFPPNPKITKAQMNAVNGKLGRVGSRNKC